MKTRKKIKTKDLSHGFFAEFYDDGSMVICNHGTGQRVDLERSSVEWFKYILTGKTTKTYELRAEREGQEPEVIGPVESPEVAKETVEKLESCREWPEGFDAVLVNRKNGLAYILIDNWVYLEQRQVY